MKRSSRHRSAQAVIRKTADKQHDESTNQPGVVFGVKADSEQTLVPYDENLLERSRTQWQFGDWESLTQLDRNTLQHHPDRAKLALMAAAGWLQISNDNCNEAWVFIRLARDWGVSNELICRILIAGVHNSLGRAATITRNPMGAIKHFEAAIDVGTPGADKRLFANARIHYPYSQIQQSDIVSSIVPDLAQHNLVNSFNVEDCSSIYRDNLSCDTVLNGIKVELKTFVCKDIKFDMFYRPDSIGDVGSIKQCLTNAQYDIGAIPQSKSLMRLYADIIKFNQVPLIIDAGANIGASCKWFNFIYQKAKLLAIEPEENNCKLLLKNCAEMPVYIYSGALADKQRVLKLYDPKESDWGFRVGLDGERDVNCIGPKDILGWCYKRSYVPLVFKVDIEGGEELLFSGDCSWLLRIPLLIIELHDWLFPEGNTSRNFKRAIARYDLQLFTRGENIFCFNKNLL